MSREVNTPEEDAALKRECIERVRFYIQKAEAKCGIVLPMPKVIFSIRGTTAGRAWIGRNLIEFNPILLRTNIEEFLGRTPGHEVAHLVAHAKYDRGTTIIKPHGREWEQVMWQLNLPAIRCHNYDMSAVTGHVKRQVAPVKSDGQTIRTCSVGKIITFD